MRLGAADAIVGDLDRERSLVRGDPHAGRCRPGVLDYVRQGLGDQEVDARLDDRWESLLGDLERSDRQRQLVGECLDRRLQSACGEKRGMDTRGQLAQVGKGGARLLRCRLENRSDAVGPSPNKVCGEL